MPNGNPLSRTVDELSARLDVPGITRMFGLRAKSQASATFCALVPISAATPDSAPASSPAASTTRAER